jgi:pyridoxamine 5'-phosphate oxidase
MTLHKGMEMKTADIISDFNKYYEEFKEKGHPEPSAMSLATTGKDGRPSSRIVLLKSVDDRGFVFYTNFTSRKGRQLEENSFAALTFFWQETSRQMRIEGAVEKVSDEEADAYFASRPKQSQIGAWASKQSQEIEHKLDFEKRVAKYTLKYALGKVPRPAFWGGFRLEPDLVEFWVKKDFRLHERTVYTRNNGDDWDIKRIFP